MYVIRGLGVALLLLLLTALAPTPALAAAEPAAPARESLAVRGAALQKPGLRSSSSRMKRRARRREN